MGQIPADDVKRVGSGSSTQAFWHHRDHLTGVKVIAHGPVVARFTSPDWLDPGSEGVGNDGAVATALVRGDPRISRAAREAAAGLAG